MIRQREVTVMVMETYQSHHLDVPVVPQILSKVEMVHKFKDKGEWVLRGGVNPNERGDASIIVVEATI